METLKSHARRVREGWFERYVKGRVLDIGSSGDAIVEGCDCWELETHGDGTYLHGIPDCTYDTIYASHVLEHLDYPASGICNWYRVLKPGGNLIICVPHVDLYERRRMLPSNYNPDHKSFWHPHRADEPCTRSLFHTINTFLPDAEILSLRVLDDGWKIVGEQQADGEFSVEAIVHKPS